MRARTRNDVSVAVSTMFETNGVRYNDLASDARSVKWTDVARDYWRIVRCYYTQHIPGPGEEVFTRSLQILSRVLAE